MNRDLVREADADRHGRRDARELLSQDADGLPHPAQ